MTYHGDLALASNAGFESWLRALGDGMWGGGMKGEHHDGNLVGTHGMAAVENEHACLYAACGGTRLD